MHYLYCTNIVLHNIAKFNQYLYFSYIYFQTIHSVLPEPGLTRCVFCISDVSSQCIQQALPGGEGWLQTVTIIVLLVCLPGALRTWRRSCRSTDRHTLTTPGGGITCALSWTRTLTCGVSHQHPAGHSRPGPACYSWFATIGDRNRG